MQCGGCDAGGDPGRSLSVQVEALVQADARAQPSAAFPASRPSRRAHAHAAEACTMPFRAGGTVRHRPDTGQLTERITLSDRELLENARIAAVLRAGLGLPGRRQCRAELVIWRGVVGRPSPGACAREWSAPRC
jgi:hypothetical protein